METIAKQRLMRFLDYLKLKPSQFERACGLSNGYIRKLKELPGYEKIEDIKGAFPELNTHWLLTGQGDMLVDDCEEYSKQGIMESAVKQRLVHFIKFMHLTQKTFEDRCGMSNGYVANIRKGIGDDKLLNIVQQFPQLNRDWLLFGEGEMLKTQQPQVQQNNFFGDNNYNNTPKGCDKNCTNCCDRAIKCPECGRVTGEVIVVEEVQKPIIPSEWAYKPNVDIFQEVMNNLDKVAMSRFIVLDSPVSAWMEVRDDSLAPRAYRGDRLGLLVYPKGEEDIIWGKFHAVDTITNGLIVRKLYPAEGGYRCVSPNEDYPDLYIKFDNIQSVSRVVYVVRKAL